MHRDGANLLELERVVKKFGGLTAVDAVSLYVNRGEIVGIIGPNGSGKTTLFATVTGFLAADAGEIRFNGQSIVGLRPFRICERGMVRTFQVVQPFEGLSVFENVQIGALRDGRSLKEAAELALEVLEFVGLQTKARRVAGELTLPECKRLELARALATQPKLLLLDEVMAGLRPREVDFIVELLHGIRSRGITILVVEHLMRAVLALSDRLYALHHGGLIAEGRPNDVIHHPAVVDAYFGEAGVDS